jgi:hypothetical protein
MRMRMAWKWDHNNKKADHPAAGWSQQSEVHTRGNGIEEGMVGIE